MTIISSNVDKNLPSQNNSKASHDPTGRHQSCTNGNKATSVSQDPLQYSGDHPHTAAINDNFSNQEVLAIKDKASTKLADVDFNNLSVFIFDEEQPILLSSTATGNEDFIRVTSKKRKEEEGFGQTLSTGETA